MGRQGVTWAGKVAIKICPDILEQLSSQVRKAIFATCGTNGKTTTNNMLCAALEAEGQKVIFVIAAYLFQLTVGNFTESDVSTTY